MEELLDPHVGQRLERLVQLARRARRVRRPGGFKQPAKGIEVGARRSYVTGDDPRRIDWQAYARLERLLVKVTEDLPEARLDLLLDGSASMRCGEPRPALRAALAAAGLAAVALARELKVGVWVAGPGADQLQLARTGELVRLMRFLAEPRSGDEGPSLETLAGQVGKRIKHPGAAILLSDGLAPDLAAAARRLRLRGCQARVALVETEAELGPSAAELLGEGAEVELVDAESGARVRRTLGPVGCAAAASQRAARQRALAGKLEAVGVGCLWLPPADPFERLAEVLLRGA